MYIKVKSKWQLLFDFLMIMFGTSIMGFAFSIFLEPNNISTGGFSGLAMIINVLLNSIGVHFLNSSIIYFILNIGLFLYTLRTLGRRFAIKSLFGIAWFSLTMEIFSLLNINFTFEPLISAMYGGAIMGVGIGFVVRFGGSTGGGDMIASIVRNKNPKISIGSIVVIIDIIVVLLSLIVFPNGVQVLPYTIIALGLCSVCTDFVNDGYKQVRAYHIITNKGDEVSQKIMENLSRGCTRTKCEWMYSHDDKDYLICLVSKFQIATLTKILKDTDPNAFMYSTKVSDVIGFWTKPSDIDNEVNENLAKQTFLKQSQDENKEVKDTPKDETLPKPTKQKKNSKKQKWFKINKKVT